MSSVRIEHGALDSHLFLLTGVYCDITASCVCFHGNQIVLQMSGLGMLSCLVQ